MICIFSLSHILYTILTIALPYLSCSKSISSVAKKKTKYTYYIKICEFPELPYSYWSSSLGTISTVKQSLAVWISGTVQAVYAYRKMNSKLKISLLSYRLGSLFAPIPLLLWYISSCFNSLTKDKFMATLNWFTLAWGWVAQSRFSQKWFVLTWLRSGHLLSFLSFLVYHTLKLNDIYPCLEANGFFP